MPLKINPMKKLLFIAFLSTIIFSWSCEKFSEDDYWFTLRTVKNRITGYKRLVYSNSNGINYLDTLNFYFKKPVYFEFTNEPLIGSKLDYHLFIFDSLTNERLCVGWWSYDDFYSSLSIRTSFNDKINKAYCCHCDYFTKTNYRVFAAGGNIIKLSNNEIWTEGFPNRVIISKFLRYEK